MAWHTTTAVVFPPKGDREDSPKRKQTHSASLGRWYTKASDAYACGMLMIMPRRAQQLGRISKGTDSIPGVSWTLKTSGLFQFSSLALLVYSLGAWASTAMNTKPQVHT